MIWFFLFACRSSDPTTLGDELRVMAIQSDPAEIGVEVMVPNVESKDPMANIVIADPLEKGGYFAVWTCTNFGDGCLEAEFYAENPNDWIQVQQLGTPLQQHPINVHPAIWSIIGEMDAKEQPFKGTALWVLACEDGACPALEQVIAGVYDVGFFTDPFSMMSDLPIQGTSLSFRPLLLSARDEAVRIKNPEITPIFTDNPVTEGEESVMMSFDYELFAEPNDDSFVYAFTTLGGFAANDRLNNLLTSSIDSITLEWFPPTQEEGEAKVVGDADLFVIIEDGYGGSSMWIGQGEVK